mgnify:CR=1 FL=1
MFDYAGRRQRLDGRLREEEIAALFLPLFVFLPSLLQRAMKVDIDATIEAWGKNEQVKKVFWTFFIGMAGLILARVVDPATAKQVVGLITGMGA